MGVAELASAAEGYLHRVDPHRGRRLDLTGVPPENLARVDVQLLHGDTSSPSTPLPLLIVDILPRLVIVATSAHAVKLPWVEERPIKLLNELHSEVRLVLIADGKKLADGNKVLRSLRLVYGDIINIPLNVMVTDLPEGRPR